MNTFDKLEIRNFLMNTTNILMNPILTYAKQHNSKKMFKMRIFLPSYVQKEILMNSVYIFLNSKIWINVVFISAKDEYSKQFCLFKSKNILLNTVSSRKILMKIILTCTKNVVLLNTVLISSKQ